MGSEAADQCGGCGHRRYRHWMTNEEYQSDGKWDVATSCSVCGCPKFSWALSDERLSEMIAAISAHARAEVEGRPPPAAEWDMAMLLAEAVSEIKRLKEQRS